MHRCNPRDSSSLRSVKSGADAAGTLHSLHLRLSSSEGSVLSPLPLTQDTLASSLPGATPVCSLGLTRLDNFCPAGTVRSNKSPKPDGNSGGVSLPTALQAACPVSDHLGLAHPAAASLGAVGPGWPGAGPHLRASPLAVPSILNTSPLCVLF